MGDAPARAADGTPLARLGVAADRLRAGDGRVRVQIGGPVELKRMGSTFNEMADTLEVQQGGLLRLAYTDALTGLPNRAAILERVEAAVAANGAPALPTSAPSPAASSPWATGWTCG